jgi:hypothetical protein
MKLKLLILIISIIPQRGFSNEKPLSPFSRAEKVWMAKTTLLLDKVVYPRFSHIVGLPTPLPKIKLVFEKLGRDKLPAYVLKDVDLTIYINVDRYLDGNYEFYLGHELQHTISNHYRRGKGFEEEWISEGLSQLIEYRMTGQLPLQGVLSYLSRSMTYPLQEWPAFTHSAVDQNYYSNTFLFFFYLYNHFGQDGFLQRMILSDQSGVTNLEAALSEFRGSDINLGAIFLNFSMALHVNEEVKGSNGLLSLIGESGSSEFRNIVIQPQLLSFSLPSNSLRLAAYQSLHYFVPSTYECIQFSKNNLNIFVVDRNDFVDITPLEDSTYCFQGKPVTLLIINSQNISKDVNLSLIK